MSNTIKHRGPDDQGYYTDKNVSLGHRRLSIIDIKKGKQPIFNEDESIVIVYNGEIYIARCIDSVIQQSYKNIEVLVVNDGSTDGTLSILKNYSNKPIIFKKISDNWSSFIF